MMKDKFKFTDKDLIMKDTMDCMKNLRTYYNHHQQCGMDSERSGAEGERRP